jgi:hypothetical protein
MERGGDDAHLHAALNPALLEGASSELNTLLQEGGPAEAEEADIPAAAARALAAPPPANVDIMRRVVARWRAFVATRRACPLLDLCQAQPDFFKKEVLEQLDSTSLTMLAQVGRPWLAAVQASGLPRLPKRVRVPLRLRELWARANGCPWVKLHCESRSWRHPETKAWVRQQPK